VTDLVQKNRQGVDTTADDGRRVIGLECHQVADGVDREVNMKIGSGAIAILPGAQLHRRVGVIDALAAEHGARGVKARGPALGKRVTAEQTVVDDQCKIERDVRRSEVPGPDRGRGIGHIQNGLLLGGRQARQIRRLGLVEGNVELHVPCSNAVTLPAPAARRTASIRP